MAANDKIYGVIVEWKNEEPLIMEGNPMNYEQASKRMTQFLESHRVIRVAMFEMVYSIGNKSLIPTEKD